MNTSSFFFLLQGYVHSPRMGRRRHLKRSGATPGRLPLVFLDADGLLHPALLIRALVSCGVSAYTAAAYGQSWCEAMESFYYWKSELSGFFFFVVRKTH